MPTLRSETRSMQESSQTNEESSNPGTNNTSEDTAGNSVTTAKGVSTPPTTSQQPGNDAAAEKSNNEGRSRASKATSICTNKQRRKELAKAREEFARCQVELAAARLATLEADCEDEDYEVSTIQEERTSNWVRDSAIIQEKVRYSQETANTNNEDTALQLQADSDAPLRIPTAISHDDIVPSQSQPTIEQKKSENNSSVNYQELAAAITLAARSVQPVSNARIQELPPFNGNSSEWLPFKIVYEEYQHMLSEQENLARLRRCLRGAAREAVQCLFVGSTTAKEVMKLLASRFGRPDALVMAELDKLRTLPRLSENPREICIYASKITNIVATIRALNKPHYLYNTEVVRNVIEKFPSALRYRYYEFYTSQPEGHPDLDTLARFIDRTAEQCGSFAPAESIPLHIDRREISSRRNIRNNHVQDREVTLAQQSSLPMCPICKKENHRVIDCPTMKAATQSEKWKIVRESRVCFRCLRTRKFKHMCKTKRCDTDGCKYTHHPFLHDPSYTPEKTACLTKQEEDTSIVATVASAREEKCTTALLKILPVQLTGPSGTYDTFALLDDGSTCTLIEQSTAEKIGATGPAEPFYIEGVAGTKMNVHQSQRVHFTIRGRNSSEYTISARTMEKLKLSSQSVSRDVIQACTHLRDIEDKLTYDNGVPTILLGQDNWHLLIAHEIRRGCQGQPVASYTELGWVVHGARRARQQIHRVNHAVLISDEEEISMESLMKQHFSLDSLGIEPKRSYNNEERRALKILEEKTCRLSAGGFETGLLWKRDSISPPNSYDTAMRRLELVEKKLDRDGKLKQKYKQQIQALFENNYAKKAPENKSGHIWYLPHFGVVNPQKPDKLRIVHDAAAKSRGLSLNDMLLPGPTLLQSLTGVLMRFRQHPIAVTADIKEMFMRISVREEDRDMQRFLWRGDDRINPPTEYRMKSVIFGATSSPSTAIYVKNKNAEDYQEKYPRAAAEVINKHYVDDYLSSFSNEKEAIEIASQVAYIHRQGNFFLQKWASNSRRVQNALTPGQSSKTILQLDSEKILGMVWNTERDTLTFNITRHKIPTELLEGRRTPTKREALRVVMSIYDPLGIATPVTIHAKRILQSTWRSGIEWDTELQQNEARQWETWIKHVTRLPQLAIPRCYPGLSDAQSIQLHTFVDASSSSYAAAVYWRVVTKDGQTHVSLIAGKGKVAPLKVISIPRLELQAAVIGCRLAPSAIQEHEIKPTKCYYWSDSRTVLTWIQHGPRAYKPYVAHRIGEISETTKTNEWRWVPTKMNTADYATREVPTDFNSEHKWYVGPSFLSQHEDEWLQQTEDEKPEATGEERITFTSGTTPTSNYVLPDIKRFSSWIKLMRVTARIFQYISKLREKSRAARTLVIDIDYWREEKHVDSQEKCTIVKKRNKKNTVTDPEWREVNRRGQNKEKVTRSTYDAKKRRVIPLEAQYLRRAKQLWIRAVQHDMFYNEISSLRKNIPVSTNSRLSRISAFLDEENILRLRSRIALTKEITRAQREPIIVDGNHPWVRLYITWVHKQLHHGGYEITTTEIRQHYWVLRFRHAVRSEIQRCQECRIRKARPAMPSTGNHPRSRVAHHQRPFTFTGLDYFGPMTITVGRAHQKRYGVLFTCLTTRAIHLELANSLSTDSAVMALRRFISRRGCPTELWSDQGTNLREQTPSYAQLPKKRYAKKPQRASYNGASYRLALPSWQEHGSVWYVKTALDTTLRERAPKEEVLTTLFAEVEHTVNSRPLTHVSSSPEDDEPLTPNHFLLGGPSRVPIPGSFTEDDVISKRGWRTSQALADMFWQRWVKEYLPELQHRWEPLARGSIKLNDFLLIADGTLPRNMWPRGVVVATYPGPDGETRVVDVRTSKGVLRRPTKKLAILRVEE